MRFLLGFLIEFGLLLRTFWWLPLALGAMLWISISAEYAEARSWTAFVEDNDCQVVRKVRSRDEEVWFCSADGITYWKRSGLYRPQLLEERP